MFPSGFFKELICPDSDCKRVYCSFWHDPDPSPGPSLVSPVTPAYQPTQYTTNYSVPVQQSYDPYNPYSHEISSFPGYSASVATPISYEQIPPCSFTGYVATEIHMPPNFIPADYIPTSIPPVVDPPSQPVSSKILSVKKEPIDEDDCIIIEPTSKIKKEPLDEPSPSTSSQPPQSILKTSSKKKLPLPVIPIRKDLPNPDKSENILECAKSISEIDAEIERLKQLREQHKQKAAELRAPIKEKSKLKEERRKDEKPVLEYVPKLKTEKPTHDYTPTPLVELERKKAEKKKAEEDKKKKEREVAKSRVRRLSSSELSQEDLFGEDPVTPVKQPRLDSSSNRAKLFESKRNVSTDSANGNPVGVAKGVQLTVEQIAAAKQRVARPGAAGITRLASTNRKVASAVEQMKARMEIATKEREATAAKESSFKKPMTLEQKFGEARNKDGRTARINTPNIAKTQAVKPSLLDPKNIKVPTAIRLQYLNKINSEYLKYLPLNEAREQAELEEKSVLDKINHKKSYMVACANAMRRIREIGHGKASSTCPNKISHEQLMLGKHYGKVTVGASGPKQVIKVTEEKLYHALDEHYLLTYEELKHNSYPVWESPLKVYIEPNFYDKKRCKKTFVDDFEMNRTCVRCNKEFQLNNKGNVVYDNCIYHVKGKSRQPGKIRNNEARYPCCGGDDSMAGCQVAIAHVCDTLRECELLKFRETPKPTSSNDIRSEKIYALDCEMIYTVWGPTLARVTVVDFNEKVVLDEIVKPEYTVIDYNTTFSGITEELLKDSTHTLESVVTKFFELVNSETILIGHSLESDLKALRVIHSRVVDTSILFPHRTDEQKKRGLRELCLDKLSKSIQDDIDGHDSKEDSIAALQLVIYKAKFDGKLK